MTTPTLPQAAQIALDALVLSSTDASRINPHQQHVDAAITALREALAQPQAEPVDEAHPVSGRTDGLSQDYNGKLGKWFADRLGAREQLRRDMPAAQPAAPAVPLTDERLQRAYALGWIAASSWAKRDDLLADMGSLAYVAEMADALQACGIGGVSHGITGAGK